MTSLIPMLFMGGIALLLAIAMTAAAVIAHRGKRFWGTWMMLLGSIGLILGAVTTSVGYYFLFQGISSSSSSGPGMSDFATYSIVAGAGALIAAGSQFVYLVGLLGLAMRYGSLATRITDLETINDSLISQNEQAQS